MLIASIIVSAVLLIAIGIWIYLDFIRCRKTRAWIKKIGVAINDAELLQIGPSKAERYCPARGWHHLWRRASENAAKQKYNGAFMRSLRARLDEETDPVEHALLLLQNNYYGYLATADFNMASVAVKAAFQADIDAIMPQVRLGDTIAMHGFTRIMDSDRLGKFCHDHAIVRPQFPPNWDNWVVERIPSPIVKDFRNTPELSPGEVRLLAAEALRLRTSDPHMARKLAKLALAYCLVEREVLGESDYRSHGRSKQVINPYLVQVTDQLASQLIVMVEAMEGHSIYSNQVKLSK